MKDLLQTLCLEHCQAVYSAMFFFLFKLRCQLYVLGLYVLSLTSVTFLQVLQLFTWYMGET